MDFGAEPILCSEPRITLDGLSKEHARYLRLLAISKENDTPLAQ